MSCIVLNRGTVLRLVAPVLVCGVLPNGCSQGSPSAASKHTITPAPSKYIPSTFSEWCRKESFGLDSPEKPIVSNPVSSYGFVELTISMPVKTDQEAAAYLAKTVATLRQKAEEEGCEYLGRDEYPSEQMTYRTRQNVFTLHVTYKRGDTKDIEKVTKAYWMTLRVDERAGRE